MARKKAIARKRKKAERRKPIATLFKTLKKAIDLAQALIQHARAIATEPVTVRLN